MNLEEFEQDYYNIVNLEKTSLYNEQKEIIEQLKQVSGTEELEKSKLRLTEIQSELSGLDNLDKSLELIRVRAKSMSEKELEIFRDNEITFFIQKIKELKNTIDNLEDKSSPNLKPYVKKLIEYQDNLRSLLPDDLKGINADVLRSKYFKKRANGKESLGGWSYLRPIEINENDNDNEEKIDLFNLYLDLPKEKKKSIYDKLNERNSLRDIMNFDFEIYIPYVVGNGHGININFNPFKLNPANAEDVKNKFDKQEEMLKNRVFSDTYLTDKQKEAKITELYKKFNYYKEEFEKYYKEIKQKEQEYNSKVKDLDLKIMLDFSHHLNKIDLDELENIVMQARKFGKSSDDIAIDMSGEIKRMQVENLINSEAERLTESFYWNYRDYKIEPQYNLAEARKLADERSYPAIRNYIDETFDFDYYQEHFNRYNYV